MRDCGALDCGVADCGAGVVAGAVGVGFAGTDFVAGAGFENFCKIEPPWSARSTRNTRAIAQIMNMTAHQVVARDSNVASGGVSRKLGYADDGLERWAVRGELTVHRRYRIDRPAWLAHRSMPVTVDGLTERCLADLGATAAAV